MEDGNLPVSAPIPSVNISLNFACVSCVWLEFFFNFLLLLLFTVLF